MQKKFDFDFEVSSSHMDAAGWKLGKFNSSNPFDCHVIYIRDFRRKHVQLFSVPMKHFDATPLLASPEEVTGDIGRIMKKYAKGKVNRTDERLIGPAVVMYLKGSKAYQVWKDKYGPDVRIHGIIHIYNGGMFRPALIGYDATIIPSDEFMNYSDQIMAADKQNHPEWFR